MLASEGLTIAQLRTVLALAVNGKRVAVVGRASHLDSVFSSALTHAKELGTPPAKTSLANGRLEIAFPSGGSVRFRTADGSVGHELDAIAYLSPLELTVPALITRGGVIVQHDGSTV